MGRNLLKLDVSGFEEYLHKLEELEADLKPIVEDALSLAGYHVTKDTLSAVKKPNLPAKGIYSKGKTEKSVIKDIAVKWEGTTASVGLGFDFTAPGAGGYLITGTPRMPPDKELNRIYKSKSYMKDIQKEMTEVFQDEISRRIGG